MMLTKLAICQYLARPNPEVRNLSMDARLALHERLAEDWHLYGLALGAFTNTEPKERFSHAYPRERFPRLLERTKSKFAMGICWASVLPHESTKALTKPGCIDSLVAFSAYTKWLYDSERVAVLELTGNAIHSYRANRGGFILPGSDAYDAIDTYLKALALGRVYQSAIWLALPRVNRLEARIAFIAGLDDAYVKLHAHLDIKLSRSRTIRYFENCKFQ